jgi:colanic acid biosynthesis protein WcaH
MRIPEDLYASIRQAIPIICVDLVIENSDGHFLLVKRTNHPLKAEWWVPGGRLLHSETVMSGAIRKGKEELGIELENLTFMGFFEEIFEVDCRGADIPYHTISLVYRSRVVDSDHIRLDEQSSDFIWATALPEKFIIKKGEGFQ